MPTTSRDHIAMAVDGYGSIMFVALVVIAVIGLIVVAVMWAAWNKRGEHEPQTTSTGTAPPTVPDDAASPAPGPPPGSRPDREQKGQP